MSKESTAKASLDLNLFQPHHVVREALSYINDDNTIDRFDPEEGTWFNSPVNAPIDVTNLPPDTYATQLLNSARIIMGCIMHTRNDSPEEREQSLRDLAQYLGAYRHDPYFLNQAAALMEVSEDGTHIKHPHLPKESPWRWVPHSRLE